MASWGLIGQEAPIARLEAALQAEKVPHGLLLAGPRGTGKGTAARWMAARLLCRAGPASPACGECTPCRHRLAGTAPDLTLLTAEAGEEIRVDSLREMTRQVQLTPQESRRRAVIIDPAEAMGIYAANALLKILEEPPGQVLFLLVSHRPDRLLPTIRSRCQPVRFRPAPAEAVEEWLQTAHELRGDNARLAARMAGGAPGQALEWARRAVTEERDALVQGLEAVRSGGGESLVGVAGEWAEADPDSWLPHFLAWLRDLARVTVSGGMVGQQRLVNFDRQDYLAEQARSIGPPAAERLLRAGERLAEMVSGRTSTRLAIEEFLVWWREPDAMPRFPSDSE
ncbi:DNA polymerase III subunit delta' [Thiohalorhabdus methylotrophus]|uniref:DNA-directed DNA polymerase n=1 Tax=Thiohalorhabdus methylotrophus TaxID=3242694 RepID=A0ABV4TXM9_9GAMM